MAQHTTWEGVFKEIKTVVAKALQDDVARTIRDTIQKYILETVYAETPIMYERTFEFLRALTIGKVQIFGNNISVEVYIDSDKIIPYTNDGEDWNKHASFDGTPYNEELPWLLEKGTQLPTRTPYITPAFQYMSKSKTEIEDRQLHLKKIEGFLKSKGINIILI